jgi:hypothetical protein
MANSKIVMRFFFAVHPLNAYGKNQFSDSVITGSFINKVVKAVVRQLQDLFEHVAGNVIFLCGVRVFSSIPMWYFIHAPTLISIDFLLTCNKTDSSCSWFASG